MVYTHLSARRKCPLRGNTATPTIRFANEFASSPWRSAFVREVGEQFSEDSGENGGSNEVIGSSLATADRRRRKSKRDGDASAACDDDGEVDDDDVII